MEKLQLLDLFKEKIQEEYDDYFNSLFSKDKSELLKEDNIEEIFYMQKFKKVAENLEDDIDIEFIFNTDNVLRKAYIIYHFDSFADDRTNYNYIFHDMVDYEKCQVRAKIDKSNSSLAERLDYFYADNNPYDRYDSVGSFSPEYDSEGIGLSQIKECLNSQSGKENLRQYLYDIIVEDYDDNVKEKAKQFLAEINDYNIQHNKDENQM